VGFQGISWLQVVANRAARRGKVAVAAVRRVGVGFEAMCERCIELDERLDRYRSFAARAKELEVDEALQQIALEMQVLKARLHPRYEQAPSPLARGAENSSR